VVLSGQAIRGVALGVVVTALVQALVGGIGLAIARVPFAAVLTAVMFLLAVAQIGAAPVMIVAVIWLYWAGSAGWGTFLLVVTVIVGTLDNFLRPILIKKGADLPLLLIFAGVIGGLIGFGLIGIFVGPMVLAVTYTLLRAWIEDGESGRLSRTAEFSPRRREDAQGLGTRSPSAAAFQGTEKVIGPCGPHFRFSFRTTSFSPDQTSSTAHTLMSTRPMGSATALIVSSVMSVGTLEDFFGHETQIAASGRIFASEARRREASRALSVVKRWTMSVLSSIFFTTRALCGTGAASSR
jgi:hypothetical protein